MSARMLLPALSLVLMLTACSESNVAPGPDADLRGQVRDDAGRLVADAGVFLEYDIDIPDAGAPNDLAAKPATAIRFLMPMAAEATVWVSDFCETDTVRALVDGSLPAGEYAVTWDGRDDDGRLVPDGVYWLQVRTPTHHESTAALLLHLGYSEVTAATAVATLACTDERGRYRLGQDCLALGLTFAGTDESGNLVGTVAVTRHVRVWALHPDHGLGHTDWLDIDAEQGLVADIVLTNP